MAAMVGMSADVQIEVKTGYLHLHCRGDFSATAVAEAVETAFQMCAKDRRGRILIDISECEGLSPSIFERYQFGVEAAKFHKRFAYDVRVAILGGALMIDPHRFGETVAVNRGAQAGVFTDLAAAVAWLEDE
jgi:hypothetical protein